MANKFGETLELLIDGTYYYVQWVGKEEHWRADVVAVLDVGSDRPLSDEELEAASGQPSRFTAATFFADLVHEPAYRGHRGVFTPSVAPGAQPDPDYTPPHMADLFEGPALSMPGMFITQVATGFRRGHELEWMERNRAESDEDELELAPRAGTHLHWIEVSREEQAEIVAARLADLGYEPKVMEVNMPPEDAAFTGMPTDWWVVEAVAREPDGSDLTDETVEGLLADFADAHYSMTFRPD